MATWREELKVEGLLLAGLGFGITRLVVAESLQADAALPFLVAGLIPLVLGLGLTSLGVVLTVGAFRQAYVRSITLWAYLGTGAMLLVIGVTAVAALVRTAPMNTTIGSGFLVANVILGGAIGGAITGYRTAANQRHREEISRQIERATLINRILRDEVLNATQVVQGYASLLRDRHDIEAITTIDEAADRIERTIENVGRIVEDSTTDLTAMDLSAVVADELDHFDVATTETSLAESAYVPGDHRLRILIRELARAISVDASDEGDSSLTVDVTADDRSVRLRVAGPNLAIRDRDRESIQDDVLPEYDDPESGLGMQTVRLLVKYYDGEINIEDDAVTITLPRVSSAGDPIAPLGIGRSQLVSAVGAAGIAGVVMGGYLQVTAEIIPVIGALYTVPNQMVGWITHLFHSIVFGLVFAAGMSRGIFRRFDRIGSYVAVGVGWGVVLWLVAAGLVMPAWLRATGAQVMLPNLTGPGLVSHGLWGATLGGLYAAWGRGG